MQVEVRPINAHGRPLPKSQRMKNPPSRGKLRIAENRLHRFGRVVRCATLKSTTDGLDTLLLPELMDAELMWLDTKSLRLKGIEQVDGALYAQTWDVSVL